MSSQGVSGIGPRIRMPQELPEPGRPAGGANPLGAAGSAGLPEGPSFSDTVKEFIGGVNELQHTADARLQSFVRGEAELHDVAIASQEASIAMRLTREIRDRLLAAYQEVMRTQM